MLLLLKRESKRFWLKMSLRKTYSIKPISYKEAMDIVVEKHYLHRKCPVSHAYGLIDIRSGEVVGVVTYGVSPSSTLLKGICGPEEARNVYELNRLWVDDKVAKNGESYLVANSMKLLDREIIVSFADTSQGHVGYIYQAANFGYYGLSSQKNDFIFANGKKLTRGKSKGFVGKWVPRSRKHRYVYLIDKSLNIIWPKERYPK